MQYKFTELNDESFQNPILGRNYSDDYFVLPVINSIYLCGSALVDSLGYSAIQIVDGFIQRSRYSKCDNSFDYSKIYFFRRESNFRK